MHTDEMFIGREYELERLRREVFFPKAGSESFCYSLIGLNGVGKTTLIRRLADEFKANRPENAFYFRTEITMGVSFWQFWGMLVREFSRSITEAVLTRASEHSSLDWTEEIVEIYTFFNDHPGFEEEGILRSQAIVFLSELFQFYTEMGIRIIITIDEFDRASKAFDNGQFFQFLFNLSPKSGAYNLSILTISRRRVSTIAHHMQEGSDFEAAYPPFVLKGFNNAELSAYFDTYEQLPCGLIPEEARKQVLYLCGRSPGLLMGFRHELEYVNTLPVDIGWVYAESCQFIKNAYDRMISLMESTFADRDQQKPLLEVFIQKFIGPAYEDNFGEVLPLLCDYGFVTRGTVASNIFSMAGMEMLDAEELSGNEIVFEPIAPYFVEYVRYRSISDSISRLTGLLSRAEKLVREVITDEMRQAYPDTWKTIINGYAERKEHFLDALRNTALQNDFSLNDITKLNVISFKEYYEIMVKDWKLFSKYFTAYSDTNELYAAIAMLNECRNTSAHLNLMVYNGENRRKLKATCEKFIRSLENDPSADVPADAGTSRTAVSGAEHMPTEEEIAALEGKIVTFCCLEVKKPRNNLRGYIKENGFPATVSKNKQADFGFAQRPAPGDSFSAMVERWDHNANVFNLTAGRR